MVWINVYGTSQKKKKKKVSISFSNLFQKVNFIYSHYKWKKHSKSFLILMISLQLMKVKNPVSQNTRTSKNKICQYLSKVLFVLNSHYSNLQVRKTAIRIYYFFNSQTHTQEYVTSRYL